jgi:hypothetical protein
MFSRLVFKNRKKLVISVLSALLVIALVKYMWGDPDVINAAEKSLLIKENFYDNNDPDLIKTLKANRDEPSLNYYARKSAQVIWSGKTDGETNAYLVRIIYNIHSANREDEQRCDVVAIMKKGHELYDRPYVGTRSCGPNDPEFTDKVKKMMIKANFGLE